MAKRGIHPRSFLLTAKNLIEEAFIISESLSSSKAKQIKSLLLEAVIANDWAYDELGRLEDEFTRASATANDNLQELNDLRKSLYNRKPEKKHYERNNVVLAETAKANTNVSVSRTAKVREEVRRDILRMFADRLRIKQAEFKEQLVGWGNRQKELKIEITPESVSQKPPPS